MAGLTLQAAFTSGELAPSLSARIDLAKYQQGCRTLRNFKVQPHGGATRRPGFILLDELPGEAALIKFVFNKDQAYCLAFGNKWLRVFTHDGPVLGSTGAVYHMASPYTLAQAKTLSVAQSGDVLFIACWGVAPQKLKRLGHNDWVFEAMSFTAPIAAPAKPGAVFKNEAKKSDGSPSAAQLVTPYTYYVTAVNADGKESELSPGIEITGPSSNNWQGGDYMVITWTAVSGAAEYRVYKAEFGGRAGYLNTVTGASYKDYNVSASMSEGAPKYENPFSGSDYPGVVCFFEQRLVFASSPNRPQTLWMSKSGDYGNFARYSPQADDSPIELTLASAEVSSMSWMVALRSLVLGSTSMEWEISAGQGGAFSAKNAKATPQSYIGSAKIPPIIVGNTVLHVARSGAMVRNFQYDFGSDSYGGTDCTILAAHLLEKEKVVSWAYQQHPDSIIWIVRSDGVLLGLTYQAEHQVLAWHRHDTQGLFKWAAAVPHGFYDDLFVVVKRGNKFLLERQADQFTGGDYRKTVFLDSALVYEGAPVKTLSGLGHLEGLSVGILQDGFVGPERVVTGGRVELDRPASYVVVGLSYVSDLETMPVEMVTQDGSTVGRKKYINAVNVLFHETVLGKAGSSFTKLEEVKWRSDEKYSAAPRSFSGIKNVALPTLAENVNTVCIRQDSPTPMTVLALMPQMSVN